MKQFNKLQKLISFISITIAVAPLVASAKFPPETTADIVLMLCSIASLMFAVFIVISVIMVIVAAYYYVVYGTNPEKVSEAHYLLLYCAIGIVVALLAKAFPTLISSIVGGGALTGCL